MGGVMGITRKTGPGKYQIHYLTTGEEQSVAIDPDKSAIFRDQDIRDLRPMGCPFLRFKKEGEAVCSVHDSRPGLCRQYSCFRVLVMDDAGHHIGRVQPGSRFFSTLDAGLRKRWQDEIAGVSIPDDNAWESHVAEVFSRAGYRVVR
jgi:Fe-S-cluster containining protein